MKPLILIVAFLVAALVHANAEADVPSAESILKARLDGDRTGACVMAAVVTDRTNVTRASWCEDKTRAIDAKAAFEIGSISKTMNALLLAGLAEDGKISLDDPIKDHLPKGTTVPEFDGEPIRIKHLVSHTSGLPGMPARFAPKHSDNPYVDLTEAQLLGSLGDVTLTARPGTNWAYSNFGAMVLSTIVTRVGGNDYADQMKAVVFDPIGMAQAHIGKPDKGVTVVQGHLGAGKESSAWDFDESMSGVGGVRASLDDLVRYVQVQLDPDSVPVLAKSIRRSHDVVFDGGPRMAWGWVVDDAPSGDVYAHEGGTGGFSSLAMFQPKSGKGVVVLSDTSFTDIGGLSDLAQALVTGDASKLAPRKTVDAPKELLAALEGDWLINGGLPMKLWAKDGVLQAQAQGQSAFDLGYDSAGQFHAHIVDLVLVPMAAPDGQYSLILRQGGGAMPVVRPTPAKPALTLDAAALDAYPGNYPLAAGFELKVFVQDNTLHAQATGQGAFPLVAEATDVFTARAYGIEIRFTRDVDGKVDGLSLLQAGHETKAKRQ